MLLGGAWVYVTTYTRLNLLTGLTMWAAPFSKRGIALVEAVVDSSLESRN